jgi:hypothetical protein
MFCKSLLLSYLVFCRIAAAGSDNRIKIFTTDLVEGTDAEVMLVF